MQNPNIQNFNQQKFRFYVDISNRNPKELRDLALHLSQLGAISSSHPFMYQKISTKSSEELSVKLGNQLIRSSEKDKKTTKNKKQRFYHILKVEHHAMTDTWQAIVTDMREYSEDGNVYCLDYNVIMRTKRLVPEDKFWTLT